MQNRPDILNKILTEAREHQRRGTPTRAIFDLDSTLFDVSPRIARILNDFAADPEMLLRFPNETKVLALVEPHVKDYGVRRTLERYGFEPPSPEFAKILVDYWKGHFFGNDYLKYDMPYPGSQTFVQDLYALGTEIYYLTGRDIPRMLQGTINSLEQHGFPLKSDRSNLILKPVTGSDDAVFKKDFFLQMDRSSGPAWFFENEPANIYTVIEHCPHINIIFVETVHSESMPPPGANIPKICGFI